MGLGKRIFTLWRLRPYVAACALLATFVALYSVAHISLAPPSLRPRALQMATATTHLVVDTPKTTILDLRQNTYSFEALTQRAILLGNVMANGQVRTAIAEQANVPVDVLQISAPLTAKEPRATPGSSDRQKKTSDIFRSTDQYRLSIQANPTVPVLDIYAQAPTAAKATVLANASVDSLRTYLEGLAASKQVPAQDQIKILQLGRARGTVINKGIDWQTSFLAFWLTFGFACASVIFLSRIRRGWKLAALAERRPAEG